MPELGNRHPDRGPGRSRQEHAAALGGDPSRALSSRQRAPKIRSPSRRTRCLAAAVSDGRRPSPRADMPVWKRRRPLSRATRDDRSSPSQLLRERLGEACWRTRVPFFIPLRRSGQAIDLDKLPKLVLGTIEEPPDGWTAAAVKSALLLIDGVDEVPAGPARQAALSTIQTWAKRFPGAQMVVTSRPGAVPEGALPEFTLVRLDELDEAQTAPVRRPLAPGAWTPVALARRTPAARAPGCGRPARVRARNERSRISPPIRFFAAAFAHCIGIGGEKRRARHSRTTKCWSWARRFCRRPAGVSATRSPKCCWNVASASSRTSTSRTSRRNIGCSTSRRPQFFPNGLGDGRGRHALDHDAEERRSGGQTRAPIATRPSQGQSVAVLTALIERSGLLRGAGEDEIEFAHNTLKAFLAARHYLNANAATTLARKLVYADLAELRSGLDEVAVFCAASPTGQTLRDLADRPGWHWRRGPGAAWRRRARPRAADACCTLRDVGRTAFDPQAQGRSRTSQPECSRPGILTKRASSPPWAKRRFPGWHR